MKYISDILKEFSAKQRLVVLIMLLAFMSVTYITTTYLKSDTNQCSSLIKENRELLKDLNDATDFARKNLSNSIHPEPTVTSGNEMADSSAKVDTSVMMFAPSEKFEINVPSNDNIVDSLVKITTRHSKR